ncbi:leucine-rich repeat protein SHOC-2-like [Periplaneta americana]|uniref:leucine-rich repeat protein SHOC-2-like n=1 Tax=Periplaneta americana TaxID=6978 RepID=UPI0037E74C3E
MGSQQNSPWLQWLPRRSDAVLVMGTFYHFVREHHMLAMVEEALAKRSMTLNLSYFEMAQVPHLLTSLSDVRKLYLHNNKLTILPNDMTFMKSLCTLTLDYNRLTKLPSPLGAFKQLVCLNISYNPIKSLSPEVGDLLSLEVLWLNHTELQVLPPEIGKLINLDTLGARGNNIKELPDEMGNLERLRWLTLENNQIKEIPSTFDNLSNLVHLNLNHNKITSIPTVLTAVKGMKYVMMIHNHISAISPITFQEIAHLKKLDLRGNSLPSQLVIECKNYPNIVTNEEDTETVQQNSDSESEDWEESVPSSEIDLSESSDDEREVNDIVAAMLPKVSKFAATGC